MKKSQEEYAGICTSVRDPLFNAKNPIPGHEQYCVVNSSSCTNGALAQVLSGGTCGCGCAIDPRDPAPTLNIYQQTERDRKERNRQVQSCFTEGSKVMMADYSEKPIEEIKVGDLVLSGKTLTPVKVIILMNGSAKDINLIGFNDIKPFSTENHTFISTDKKRVCANPEMALAKKHWDKDSLGKLEKGTLLYKTEKMEGIVNRKEEKVENMITKKVNENVNLYDIITSDNSFIVNSYCVNDDFPDIKSHPIASLRIFNILEKINDKEEINEDLIKNIVKEEKYNKVDESLFQSSLEKFIFMCSQNSNLINKANYLWINHFNDLKE